MSNNKTVYTAEFKAKVAMDAISERLTISELCSKYHLHSTQVCKWKKDLIERSKEIFEDTRKKDSRLLEKEKELEKIYNQV
jgi:transposase